MKTENKRLLKLAKFLRTVPKEKFAMGDWVADAEKILHKGDRGYMTPGWKTRPRPSRRPSGDGIVEQADGSNVDD